MISYRHCFYVSGSIASRITLTQGEAQASTAPKVRPRTVARRVPHVIVLDVKEIIALVVDVLAPQSQEQILKFSRWSRKRGFRNRLRSRSRALLENPTKRRPTNSQAGTSNMGARSPAARSAEHSEPMRDAEPMVNAEVRRTDKCLVSSALHG